MDLEARLWRIPGKRMKNAAEHRVPLSDAALEVLAQAERLHDGSDLVFPSPLKPRRPMSNMTLTKLLRDTGLAERATVHGFRSSFRDWCGETGKPRELAEAALAHAVKGVGRRLFPVGPAGSKAASDAAVGAIPGRGECNGSETSWLRAGN